jgi:hypothetical protein
MMVFALTRLILATSARASVPDASPSLACSVQRFNFIGFNNVFLRIGFFYDCLDRVTDFFYAYSVMTKPDYAFVPDARPVLAKLGPHLDIDGSDCIDCHFWSSQVPSTTPMHV